MMSKVESVLGRVTRTLVKPLEWALIFGMAVLVLDVLWGVFSRYVLQSQSSWTEELAIYLLTWISLLGAALVYGEKGHLGVDYFVKKMDPSAQRLAAAVVALVALAFSLYAMVYGGWELASRAWIDDDVSPANRWPMGVVYLSVPISGVFFSLFALEHFVKVCRGAPLEPVEAEPEMVE